MARRGFGLGQVLGVLRAAWAAQGGTGERVLVRVHVDRGCPREMALAVRGALVPERAGIEVDVRGTQPAPASPRPDAAVVVVGAPGPAALLAGGYVRSGVPVAMVAQGALDVPAVELPEGPSGLVGIVASSDPAAVPGRLGSWLAGAVPHKELALAAGLPCCRRPVTGSLVRRYALENAAIGAVGLVPGSDLPLICANQAKIALELACAHGRGLGPARAAELAGVLGAGFAWRALARAAVGLVPGLGPLAKAGIAYGGTVAEGRALSLRLAPSPSPVRGTSRAGGALLAAPERDATGEAGGGYVTIGGDAS